MGTVWVKILTGRVGRSVQRRVYKTHAGASLLSRGRLYSVDWTRDWTRDWTVGLDSQKVALVILNHQTLLKYLHDMNGIRGSRP